MTVREVPEQLTTIRASKLIEKLVECLDETMQPTQTLHWILAHREALRSARMAGEFLTGPTGGFAQLLFESIS